MLFCWIKETGSSVSFTSESTPDMRNWFSFFGSRVRRVVADLGFFWIASLRFSSLCPSLKSIRTPSLTSLSMGSLSPNTIGLKVAFTSS